MISLVKTYWLPLVALFVVFFDELFNCSAIVRGFTVDTGIKQYEAMLLAVIGYMMMAGDLLKGRINNKEHRTLVVLFLILFLYMLTPFLYGGPVELYTSYLLVFGAECIPAAYVGIRLARTSNLQRINDLLPFVVIPVSLLIGTIGLTAALMGTTVNKNSGIGVDEGLDYQILSYYMAFSYTYSFYYTFYGNNKTGLMNLLLRIVMAGDMFFCAAICLMGGGRGAFVYIVFITIFILFYYLISSKRHRMRAIIIIFSLAVVSLFVISSLGILQSDGMERVTEKLTDDNTRLELYWSAFDSFLSSPLFGWGVGSIWWTVGFYCHNAILDIMAETGIIGTLFLLSIVWRTLLKLYSLSHTDKVYLFFFLVMVGNLVNYMFSGYYIAAYKTYFVCSLVYCLPKKTNK